MTTSGYSIMLYTAGPLQAYGQNPLSGRYTVLYVVPVPDDTKKRRPAVLPQQAGVQMSNISSSNPIWYDNSKQDYNHGSTGLVFWVT